MLVIHISSCEICIMRMDTLILDSNNPDDLLRAARILENGGVIVTPTDTVYGMAADVANKGAVERIYKIKKRPRYKPLVVQISDFGQLKDLVSNVSENAEILINRFWPGSLTLVFKKSKMVPDYVTSGTPLVGIRLPNSGTVRTIIRHLGSQLVVTSTNISGNPSLTNFEQIIGAMYGKVDAIIKGKDNKASGIESTIISVVEKKPKVLRLGEVPQNELVGCL